MPLGYVKVHMPDPMVLGRDVGSSLRLWNFKIIFLCVSSPEH